MSYNAEQIERACEVATKTLKPCPCCGKAAALKTYDYLNYTVQCENLKCGLKVVRGMVLPGQPLQWCMQTVVKVWNKRAHEKKCA